MVDLSFGGYALEVLPDLGGAIRALSFEGVPVLRSVPSDVKSSGDTGCFPLIPYANRIRNGAFSFGGRDVRLPMTFPGHPHSLHGHGWVVGWTVVRQTASELLLAYDHAPDSWPWPYRGEQRFGLDENGLSVTLTVVNTGAEPMPASLGLHPWFPRTPGTILTADVDAVWLADDTMMPTKLVAGTHFFDLAKGAVLKDAPFVDNCYTGWKGSAMIDQPDLGLKVVLRADCPFLHVYAPVGSDFVCAEPVSAMPDAFNRPNVVGNGARVVQPGARFELSMHVTASR